MAGGHYRERHLPGLRSAVLPDRTQTGLLLYDLLQSSGKKTVKRVFQGKILGGEGSESMNDLEQMAIERLKAASDMSLMAYQQPGPWKLHAGYEYQRPNVYAGCDGQARWRPENPL